VILEMGTDHVFLFTDFGSRPKSVICPAGHLNLLRRSGASLQKLIGYVSSSGNKGEKGERDSGCSIQGHGCAKDGPMPEIGKSPVGGVGD
jgi:hypothetical protein